jgi:O-antigen biosynthesis protein
LTTLSVIIVNYNVPYFLEQALLSVKKAAQNIDTEIIVIDNASKDKSVDFIRQKFPEITLIANQENLGFSKANNQGISIAEGKYVLLLNPDTVVQEDTFTKCISFMEKHPDSGALGVKMIDGKGNFLPESKRALPTPKVSFFKAFGLSALFPKSKLFGQYHLGYLSENENHQVDILSGAFMFIKKEVLDKTGGFDETFFMYGEDIDLSYRILKAGYKNYYLAETSIIHYKGESTKKGSLNYVKVFYEAMLIFAKKHFSKKQASIFTAAIYLAIFIKGTITFLSGILNKISMFFFDFILSFLGIYVIKDFWAFQIKNGIDYYPPEYTFYVIPSYILVWLLSAYLVGVYDKNFQTKKIFKGIIWGTIFIAAGYGFLPESLRFSRAIILIGGAWVGIAILINRILYNILKYKRLTFELDSNKRVVIVGNGSESERALSLLKDTSTKTQFIGFIGFNNSEKNDEQLGDFEQLDDIADAFKIDEIIFCTKSVPAANVISTMSRLGERYNFKILPPQSMSIIGSDSKNSAGDLYAIDIHLKIAESRSKQLKRLFDFFSSILLIFSAPISLLIVKKKTGYLKNCLHVLSGKKTWIGYIPCEEKSPYNLPALKPGITYPAESNLLHSKPQIIHRLNLLYAKNYSVEDDFLFLIKNFRHLGN